MYSVLNVPDSRSIRLPFNSAVRAIFIKEKDFPHDIQAYIEILPPQHNADGLIVFFESSLMGSNGSNGGANSLRSVFRWLKTLGLSKHEIKLVQGGPCKKIYSINSFPSGIVIHDTFFEQLMTESDL